MKISVKPITRILDKLRGIRRTPTITYKICMCYPVTVKVIKPTRCEIHVHLMCLPVSINAAIKYLVRCIDTCPEYVLGKAKFTRRRVGCVMITNSPEEEKENNG